MGLKKLKKAVKKAVKAPVKVVKSVVKEVARVPDNINNALIKEGTKMVAEPTVEIGKDLDAGLSNSMNQMAHTTQNALNAVQGKDLEPLELSKVMKGKNADEIYERLTREKWKQFEKQDMPFILEYANRTASGEDRQRAIDQAVGMTNRGFDIAAQTQEARDRGMGLGLSNSVLTDRDSDMQRNRTAALIDAENSARTAAIDRENALLAGSHMPTNMG